MTEYRITIGAIDVEGETPDEAIAQALTLLISLARRALRGEDEIEVHALEALLVPVAGHRFAQAQVRTQSWRRVPPGSAKGATP